MRRLHNQLATLFVLVAVLTLSSVSVAQAQVCSTVPNGGIWSDHHSYPRLAAVNASYSAGNQTLTNYNQLAAYDLVLSGSYLADWDNTSRLPVSSYASYLRQQNPSIKLVPYFHAYTLLDVGQLGSQATFPDMYAVQTAVRTAGGAGGNGWWLVDDAGQPISPWANFPEPWLRNQYLINWSYVDPSNPNLNFPQWMSDYVNGHIMTRTDPTGRPYWDGFMMETDTNEPHQLAGTRWDLDENGRLDYTEQSPRKGKVWMDRQQTIGWNYVYDRVMNAFANRKIIAGGETWSPGTYGIDGTPDSWNSTNAAMVIFLESLYYDPTCGGDETRYWSGSSCITLPPGGEQRIWDFHVGQAAKFVSRNNQNIFIFKPSDLAWLQDNTYFRQFFSGANAQAKYSRFMLGSAMLVNGYTQPAPTDDLPAPWCDECGVTDEGRSAANPTLSSRGWLGCPLGQARATDNQETIMSLVSNNQRWTLSNHVWVREFASGIVYVNPTQQSKTVQLPSSGWKRISGIRDPQYNNGEAVGSSVAIPAMDALFLIRDGAPQGGGGGGQCSASGDVNRDGMINLLDLSAVISHLGDTGDSQYDITCDQTVDLRDLTTVISRLQF